MRLMTICGLLAVGSVVGLTLQGCGADDGPTRVDSQDITGDTDRCSVDADCGSGKTCLLPQCEPGGPCPGTCVYAAGRCGSDDDCKGGSCLLPQCEPGGHCPAGTCNSPTETCATDDDCGDGRQCAVPACEPGGPCPAATCVYRKGRCGNDDDCNAGSTCVSPQCEPGGPCPAGTCQPHP